MSITIEFDQMIAEGAYGRVYTTKDENYQDSVFKVFYVRDIYLPTIELDCMFRIQHPNLMSAKNIYTMRTIPAKKAKNKEVTLYKDGLGKYIVIEMEKAECDLFDWKLEKHTFEEKIKVFWQVMQGIEFFHRCHLLHLDIKTENVLIMKDGTPKVTDFGLVVPLTSHSRGRRYTREMITKNYRPPENIKQKKKRGKKQPGLQADTYYYQQKSDVWSLGVLFAEMLMVSHKDYFIEDNQISSVSFLLNENNIKNFIHAKLGRGLTAQQKQEVMPVLTQMLKINIEERVTLKKIMNHKLFRDHGLFYKDIPEGKILQPCFPPANTELTEEDYSLKLEYCVFYITTILFKMMKEYNEKFPIKVLFIAVDLFLRYRHYYDNSDTILGIAIFCAVQMCCENEIEFKELEAYLEIEGLEENWRNFLFLNQEDQENRCIFLPLTPFSKAICNCRLTYLIDLLYQNPEKYVEMLMKEDYSELEAKHCKEKPNWYLNNWKFHLEKIKKP